MLERDTLAPTSLSPKAWVGLLGCGALGGANRHRYDTFVSRARAVGVPVWPVNGAFDGFDFSALIVNKLDVHPNELANRLAAENAAPQIVATLERERLSIRLRGTLTHTGRWARTMSLDCPAGACSDTWANPRRSRRHRSRATAPGRAESPGAASGPVSRRYSSPPGRSTRRTSWRAGTCSTARSLANPATTWSK